MGRNLTVLRLTCNWRSIIVCFHHPNTPTSIRENMYVSCVCVSAHMESCTHLQTFCRIVLLEEPSFGVFAPRSQSKAAFPTELDVA